MKKKIIDMVFNAINTGVEKGIGHLYTEDETYHGNSISVMGKNLINFGSYSYLCLEQDSRLKEAANSAINNFGLQFGSSRTYMSTTLYSELEVLIDKIFGAHTVLVPTTTLGHIAVMPIVVQEGDIIIFDQNVHTSVQFMVKHLELKGVPNKLVRHNDMEALETLIIKYSKVYRKVWYMADGVYSMYGDVAPLDKIEILLKKYKTFNLYIDDAHGMSWAGKNGGGYVISKLKLSDQVLLATSLNKGFAAGGAAFVFTDVALKKKVKTCGGPLIFSGQHLMAALGGGVECAKIHLSPEIYQIQAALEKNIRFCVEELRKRNLPDMSDENTPIFFIGVGLPKVGYNMVERLQSSGYYVNLAIFPAVSENCTGVRFSVNIHHTKSEILNLIEAIDFHLYEALKEENRTVKDIERGFRKIKTYHLEANINAKKTIISNNRSIEIRTFESIAELPAKDARLVLKDFVLGYESLLDLQDTFSNNDLLEDNWQFTYVIVYKGQTPVFFTFFTKALIKDDILESETFSRSIEDKRKISPYFMCSSNMVLGTPVTFGNHVWKSKVDEMNQLEEELILDKIQYLFEASNSNSIVFRDIKNNGLRKAVLEGMGYVLSNGLNTYEIHNLLNFDYTTSLRSSQRYYVKNRAIKKEGLFEVLFNKGVSNSELKNAYNLYLNTQKRNFRLNTFPYHFSFFEKINSSQNEDWDFIRMYTKLDQKLVGIAISVRNNKQYYFLIAGLDYQQNKVLDTYSQLLHQIIKRAKKLDCDYLNLGYTTGQNKMKFGAVEVQNETFSKFKNSYVQAEIANNLLKVNH